jgi:hypothetical protein
MARGTETILVVEDEAEIREMIRDVLEVHGYMVLEARDGAEALTVSEAHAGPIAGMILDLRMPGMSTAELVERVRCSRPDLRLLYVSGYTEDEIVKRRGGLPAPGAFLQKPFSVTELADRVRAVLDTPAGG